MLTVPQHSAGPEALMTLPKGPAKDFDGLPMEVVYRAGASLAR